LSIISILKENEIAIKLSLVLYFYTSYMHDRTKYLSTRSITKRFDITSTTLRRWADEGKIRYVQPDSNTKRGGNRLYNASDIEKFFGLTDYKKKIRICY